MPVIDMPVRELMNRVNLPGSKEPISAEELAKRLPRMGCAVEDFAATRQFACMRCGKISDRTEAQGPPLHCTSCGADFRANPADLLDHGPNRVLRLELLAVRPDLFDPGGMARYVRGYLGVQTGLATYGVAPPTITVKVDPKLSEERSLRPHIACAVLRNVKLDHDTIKILMNLQEDLHWALGRNRKLASIGVYDLDTLKGTQFRYDAVEPNALKFVPLGFDPIATNSALTPAQILERHKTGQEFAHLLEPLAAYPLLRDEAGTVLSMPPIINSEATRVTLNSRQLFVDVTGLSPRSVERALNIVVTSLKEIVPQLEIEAVTIDGPLGRRVTPNLAPSRMTVNVDEASRTIGIALDAKGLAELLSRMGHGVNPAADGTAISVSVPPYRNDIMHPIDLIEDAAVAFGYDHLTPVLVPTFTAGAPRPIEEQSGLARRIFAGLGFHQVMTLVLSCETAAFSNWRTEPDPRRVKIENPISIEQTICRVSLLPGLLETLSINKQHDLPQHLFEVGDVCFFDPAVETGAREERFAAAAMIGTHVGYADIRAVADAVARELDQTISVRPVIHPSYVPGRAATIHVADGNQVGVMGELHPEVLEKYGLRHAVAVLELSLESLLRSR